MFWFCTEKEIIYHWECGVWLVSLKPSSSASDNEQQKLLFPFLSLFVLAPKLSTDSLLSVVLLLLCCEIKLVLE